LRLLDAADLIESWADALAAMLAKADAVALGLVGRAPEWAAARVLRDWRSQSAAFRALLSNADFVVVTREEPVVQEETNRLRAALLARGYQVTTKVVRITAPALRTAATSAAVADWLRALPLDLLMCAGKGGVGTSTCAAAIALAIAEQTPTCLISTDPAGSLSDVLQTEVVHTAREVAPNLRAWQLDAEAEYQRLRSRYTDEVKHVFQQLGLTDAVALDRNVIERLWNLAPPGIDEIVALTELLNAAERCQLIVLDSAPTGHFLRLIEMPEIAVDWAHALIRLLLKYKIAGSLEQFSREVLDFSREARSLGTQLRDRQKTGAVIVTLDHPVVWAETERLHARLAAAQIATAAVILNRVDAADHAPAPPAFLHGVTIIRAPQLQAPPVGAAQIRDFLKQWEFVH
jgi:TRC40/GET3/ArsA family transport-energizing ATPase